MRAPTLLAALAAALVVATPLAAQQPKAAPRPKSAASSRTSAAAQARRRDAELRQTLDRVRRALLAQDTATLARIWATGYTFTGPSGAFYDRDERLAAAVGEAAIDMPDLLPIADMSTRVVGNAVVTRTRHSRDGAEAIRAQIGDVRMLTVWERRQGRWQIAAQQATTVTGRRGAP